MTARMVVKKKSKLKKELLEDTSVEVTKDLNELEPSSEVKEEVVVKKRRRKNKSNKSENIVLAALIIILLACFVAIGFLFYKYFYAGASSNKYGDRLEGIEIVLVEKGGKAPGSTANAFSEKSTTTYVINTRTKLFHKSTCPSVKNMSESNKIYTTDSRDIIVKEGYTACKDCKP